MKKTLKLLSVILVLIISFSSVAVSAAYTVEEYPYIFFDDNIKNDGTWFYELDEKTKTAKICGYNGNEKNVVIPEMVEGEYVVTELMLRTTNVDVLKGFPIFPKQEVFETLTLPKTLRLISSYFSSEYYDNMTQETYPQASYDERKELKQRLEGELKYNGEVIMRGYFNSLELPNLKAFIVDEENSYFSSIDGVLYNKDQSVLIQYPWGKAEEKFVIPQTVKQIMPCAIKGNVGLEEIVVTENVEKLGLDSIDATENYVSTDSHSIPGYFTSITSEMPSILFLNNTLDDEQLKNIFRINYNGKKFKVTVYKDSPADKFFSESYVVQIVERLDNPYIKETEEKEETKPEDDKKDEKLSPQTGDNLTPVIAMILILSLVMMSVNLYKCRESKKV